MVIIYSILTVATLIMILSLIKDFGFKSTMMLLVVVTMISVVAVYTITEQLDDLIKSVLQ